VNGHFPARRSYNSGLKVGCEGRVQSKIAELCNQEYHLSDPNLKREVIGGNVSVLIIMERAGVTEEQYEAARAC
jgi:hypothetical protein